MSIDKLSKTEFDNLVMLFEKERTDEINHGRTPILPPENMAALMANNYPAVARKWLEEECLLDL